LVFQISIAGLTLGIDLGGFQSGTLTRLSSLGNGSEYDKFVVSESDDISLILRPAEILASRKYKHRFNSSALWVLHYNDRNDFRIEFKKGFEDATLAFIDVNLAAMEGTVFFTEAGLREPEAAFLPFVHPVDGVIFINLLPSCRGLLLHACGVDDNGRGFVFPGRSGDGKSTTARLWQGEGGVKVLSDERIILREIGTGLYACGTPWHGEVSVRDPGKVEIERLFFLEHAGRNHARPLSAMDAASKLFVRCLPTFWDKEGMELTLLLIDGIVRKIPCYELGFVPDKSAVGFVRNLD
jgi:hypothetical protein